jgi:integrase
MKKCDDSYLNNLAIDFLSDIKDFDPIMYSVFNTMSLIGARFNDVYLLDNWTVVNDDIFTLQPLKGNHKRIFTSKELDPLLVNQLLKSFNIYHNISYSNSLFWFKRIFKDHTLRCKNKSIKTHLFRHLKAHNMLSDGFEPSEIKDYLGEKHQSSADQYIFSIIKSDIQ